MRGFYVDGIGNNKKYSANNSNKKYDVKNC